MRLNIPSHSAAARPNLPIELGWRYQAKPRFRLKSLGSGCVMVHSEITAVSEYIGAILIFLKPVLPLAASFQRRQQCRGQIGGFVIRLHNRHQRKLIVEVGLAVSLRRSPPLIETQQEVGRQLPPVERRTVEEPQMNGIAMLAYGRIWATLDQVDFERRQIHLHQTKNGDPRILPLNAVAIDALERLRVAKSPEPWNASSHPS